MELADTPMPEGIELTDFTPVGLNVLVKVIPFRERTDAGIYLPPRALAADADAPDLWWEQGQPPYVGEVVKIGADVTPWVYPGDHVAFLPNAGIAFVSGGERYMLIEAPAFIAHQQRPKQ